MLRGDDEGPGEGVPPVDELPLERRPVGHTASFQIPRRRGQGLSLRAAWPGQGASGRSLARPGKEGGSMDSKTAIDREEVRAANPMVDVAARYTTLQRRGHAFWGLCPLHKETQPSFVVYPPDRWWCYGCNRGGDVFDFIEEAEHLTFYEALHFLAEGRLPAYRGPAPPKEWLEAPPPLESTPLGQKQYHLLEEVALFYHVALFANPPALRYVQGRAIRRTTIERFRAGYALPG